MRTLYTFTPDERRVVIAAYDKYTQVLRVIADLHGLQGEAAVAQDLSGFVGPDLSGPVPIEEPVFAKRGPKE
jgi:hypothetical protein